MMNEKPLIKGRPPFKNNMKMWEFSPSLGINMGSPKK